MQPHDPKIRPPAALAGKRSEWRAERRIVVHTHGVFDTLHAGTIRHFQQSRGQGDLLVVSIAPDPIDAHAPARPYFDQQARAEAVASLHCVDAVLLCDSPRSVDAIRVLEPDVYSPWDEPEPAGEDRNRARQAEAALLQVSGGRLFTAPIAHVRMPINPAQHALPIPERSLPFLIDFVRRYDISHIEALLRRTAKQRILFVGETIIDEYQYCETLGKSGKEPILAARFVSSEKFAGGILSVANQAAVICDRVSLISLLGTEDSHEDFIRSRLQPHVEPIFLHVPGSPTILKRRMVETYPFQKMFEVYVMAPTVPEASTQALAARLEEILPNFDMVVVTDYGHGMLTPEVVELLCGQDVFLAVNTQTNAANQGFNTISKYRRADFICLSEKELRLESRNRSRDARMLMQETADRLKASHMIITRGREGSLCYSEQEGFVEIPSFSNHVVDRVGAGDALLAIASQCVHCKAPLELIGFLGNVVGSQAIETVGNRHVVSREALRNQIAALLQCGKNS